MKVLKIGRSSHSATLRPPRVLIVGDDAGSVRAALGEAMPEVSATDVPSVFDALAELQGEEYGAVLVNIAPLEDRPAAAINALRGQMAAGPAPNQARLVVFGQPEHEPISRSAVDLGGDDYFLLPAQPAELRMMLTAPAPAAVSEGPPPEAATLLPDELPLVTILLDAQLGRPGAALAAAIERINTYLPAGVLLSIRSEEDGSGDLAVALPESADAPRQLVLAVPPEADEAERDVALHTLSGLAGPLAKLAELDSRHTQLQRLALTDELTGCYNRRYFRHYLDKMLAKARAERFPVTLLLFDLDDFKHYNDRYGHQTGDAILKQTAELIRRCVRDHDLVARIGGDEFAVVFWEKDAPRVPHDPDASSGARFPRGPLQIAARFRRLMAEPDFFALGATGQGSLSISGGMAVFPFDATDAHTLIEAADKALTFGAKRSGKNSIALVGDDQEEEIFT